MKTKGLTIAIITKNAAETINKAIDSASFAAKVLVLDDNSNDTTRDIALAKGAEVITTQSESFAAKRNDALKRLETDWIFYLDADELVSEELKRAVTKIVEANEPGAFKVRRDNWFLGEKMYPDWVDRLFHRKVLKEWHGRVHESPVLTEPSERLHAPLLHHTHTSIASMLEKTNRWSEMEADLRMEHHHPPVHWWRLFRMALTEGWHQLAHHQIWRFGRAGLFEAYFQMVDKMIVMVKLWERQNKSAK